MDMKLAKGQSLLGRFKSLPDLSRISSSCVAMELKSLGAARVLTKKEFELFQQINPREFLNQSWQNGGKKAPNITNLITRFNEVSLLILLLIQGELLGCNASHPGEEESHSNRNCRKIYSNRQRMRNSEQLQHVGTSKIVTT